MIDPADKDFEAIWSEGETPAPSNPATDLSAQREAVAAEASKEFADAWDQADAKPAASTPETPAA